MEYFVIAYIFGIWIPNTNQKDQFYSVFGHSFMLNLVDVLFQQYIFSIFSLGPEMSNDISRRKLSISISLEILLVLFKMFSSVLFNNKSLKIKLDKPYRV